jgi:excisionase family DNA binding protein
MTSTEPTLVEIDKLCSILGIGKNTAYDLLNNSEIDAFKIGTVWKIPKKSIDEYIDRKCREHRETSKQMCKIVK